VLQDLRVLSQITYLIDEAHVSLEKHWFLCKSFCPKCRWIHSSSTPVLVNPSLELPAGIDRIYINPTIDPGLTGGSGGTGKVLWPTGLICAGGKGGGEGEGEGEKKKAKAKEDAPATPKARVYSVS